MFAAIIALLVSFIPAVLLYIWCKSKVRKPADDKYKNACRDALIKGFLCVFPVMLISAGISLLFRLAGIHDGHSLLESALHVFFVLAFSEELCKTYMFTRVLKKADYSYTWLDMIIFMTIVAVGFEVLEGFVYAVDSGPIHMLVRGITLMHGGYGFIEGWFYGKAKYTGNKLYAAAGFAIAWILHGAYDFGLSDDFAALGEDTAFLSVSLALLALITFIVMIIFFAKKNKKEKYLVPLA